MKGYGKTYQRRKKMGAAKGGKYAGGWPNNLNPPNAREYPVGGEYAASNWAGETSERSDAKHIHLLGEFPSYSEWGKKQDDGIMRYITIR